MLSRATMPPNKQNYKLVLVVTDITEQVKRAHALERQSDRLRTLNDAMRKISFEGLHIWEVWKEISILGVWCVVSYIILVRVFRWE